MWISDIVICTKCQTDHAHRSHRHGLKDYVVSLFQYYPYQCNECGHRFYEFRRKSPKTTERPTTTETEMRATLKRFEWKRHRRDFLLYGLAILVFAGFLYYATRDRGDSSNGE